VDRPRSCSPFSRAWVKLTQQPPAPPSGRLEAHEAEAGLARPHADHRMDQSRRPAASPRRASKALVSSQLAGAFSLADECI